MLYRMTRSTGSSRIGALGVFSKSYNEELRIRLAKKSAKKRVGRLAFGSRRLKKT